MTATSKRCRRAQAIVDRLALAFSVPTVAVHVDLKHQGWLGAYRHGGGEPRIILRPRARPLGEEEETLAHEFAHHVDCCRDGHSEEPPRSLPEVRTVIRGTKRLSEMPLEFLPLEMIPRDWRVSP